jgi:hypothetical protein
VYRPIVAANMSAAYLYHMIERHMPTMLIDEGDTFVRKNSDLTGIINSGHTRTGAILNVSSVAGHKVPAGGTVCAAIKHAVRALSEGLRRKSILMASAHDAHLSWRGGDRTEREHHRSRRREGDETDVRIRDSSGTVRSRSRIEMRDAARAFTRRRGSQNFRCTNRGIGVA